MLGPLAVDGLMVMATGAILATGHAPAHRTRSVSVPAAPDLVRIPAPTPPAVPTPRTHRAGTGRRPDTTAAPGTGSDAGTRDGTDRCPDPGRMLPPGSPRARRASRCDRPPLGPSAAGTSKPTPRKTARPLRRELAAPATDTPVTAPEPAQLPLPTVDPGLLAKAREVAQQYRTEHGTPITAGQLAARLRVNSEQATQALAVLGPRPGQPHHADPDRQRPSRAGDPVTVSTLSVVPEASASGTAPCAEPGTCCPPGGAPPPTCGCRPSPAPPAPTTRPGCPTSKPPPRAPARSGSPTC